MSLDLESCEVCDDGASPTWHPPHSILCKVCSDKMRRMDKIKEKILNRELIWIDLMKLISKSSFKVNGDGAYTNKMKV